MSSQEENQRSQKQGKPQIETPCSLGRGKRDKSQENAWSQKQMEESVSGRRKGSKEPNAAKRFRQRRREYQTEKVE